MGYTWCACGITLLAGLTSYPDQCRATCVGSSDEICGDSFKNHFSVYSQSSINKQILNLFNF